MDIKEAKEIVRAGLAFASWTPEQHKAFSIAYDCMSRCEALEHKADRLEKKIDYSTGRCKALEHKVDYLEKEVDRLNHEKGQLEGAVYELEAFKQHADFILSEPLYEQIEEESKKHIQMERGL